MFLLKSVKQSKHFPIFESYRFDNWCLHNKRCGSLLLLLFSLAKKGTRLSFMDCSVVCKRKTFVDSTVQQLRDITAINSEKLLKLKKEGIGDNWLLPMLNKGCQLFSPDLHYSFNGTCNSWG